MGCRLLLDNSNAPAATLCVVVTLSSHDVHGDTTATTIFPFPVLSSSLSRGTPANHRSRLQSLDRHAVMASGGIHQVTGPRGLVQPQPPPRGREVHVGTGKLWKVWGHCTLIWVCLVLCQGLGGARGPVPASPAGFQVWTWNWAERLDLTSADGRKGKRTGALGLGACRCPSPSLFLR
jgi:hypothetical protein